MRLERFVAINAPASAAASSALARMTRREAVVKLRHAKLIGPGVDGHGLDAKTAAAGVYMTINGGLQGAAVLCFPEANADAIGEILVGRPAGGSSPQAEIRESALKELGNVICGNYVSALSNRMRVKVTPGIPYFTRGTCLSILERVVERYALEERGTLLIDVELGFPEGVALGRLLLCFKTGSAIDIRGGSRPAR